MRRFLPWLLEPAVRLLKRWMARGGMLLSIDSGGSAPAPDPRIGEALAFSKKVYEEGKPRQAALDALIDQQQARAGTAQGVGTAVGIAAAFI